MKAIVIKDVNLLSETSVSYPVETISEIVHGKCKDYYTREDIGGNDARPNDSVMILRFKDGTTASFGSDWKLIFE